MATITNKASVHIPNLVPARMPGRSCVRGHRMLRVAGKGGMVKSVSRAATVTSARIGWSGTIGP